MEVNAVPIGTPPPRPPAKKRGNQTTQETPRQVSDDHTRQNAAIPQDIKLTGTRNLNGESRVNCKRKIKLPARLWVGG